MSLDVTLCVMADVGREQPHCVDLFDANITHNLGRMAEAAGIYGIVWRPEENGVGRAGDIAGRLRAAIARMKDDPGRFRAYDAPNGWGIYDDFLPWLERYAEACESYPGALIRASR